MLHPAGSVQGLNLVPPTQSAAASRRQETHSSARVQGGACPPDNSHIPFKLLTREQCNLFPQLRTLV
jgi:hypothetical protein